MKQMKLGLFFHATGHHVAAWRHPDAQADAGVNFAHYTQVARTAERGKFDFFFVSDTVAVRNPNESAFGRIPRYTGFVEPFTLLGALSAVTQRLGLVATVSTTYNEPFNVARKFASLDQLSGGRAGWNLVTSTIPEEVFNFNLTAAVPHAERYERGREFAAVVKGLWDSWDDGAFVRDKPSGIFFDKAKLQVLDHQGKHFAVRGPLNVPRSAQGQPVIVQAGSSEIGREFAAETAEVIFTAQPNAAAARRFYADVKSRLAKYHRRPEHLVILPGAFIMVGRTQAEAEDKYAELQNLVDPAVGVSLLSEMMSGVDLSPYPVDGPLPDLPETNGNKSRFALLSESAQHNNLTIRELYLSIAGARGHFKIIGTPKQIADQFEEWITTEASDGFNIMPPMLPGALEEFVDLVVPELQRRELLRGEYEGWTLRENLGLPVPARVTSSQRERRSGSV